jgi:prepilin-type N-terminal cleavage/methylation domain-containing protein
MTLWSHHDGQTASGTPDPRLSKCESGKSFRNGLSGWGFRAAGFTLIEIVVVLALLAVVVAGTIPSMKGFKDEQIASEPLERLKTMAKETRLHAIREKRPYQIVFTEKRFQATRYLSPYLQLADLDRFLETAKVSEDQDEAAKADPNLAAAADLAQPGNASLTPTPPPGNNAFNPNANANAANSPQQVQSIHPFKEWTDSYTLPQGVTYTVQNWYEVTPTEIAGDVVKLWVFQPSGMCMPVTVHMERATASLEATFNALTADVTKESSSPKK